jgi:glycoside/pentoside/hexuronide:cation symporter, GPH family
MAKSGLKKSWIFAYSAPMVPIWALHTPALSILPGVYAKFSGIDLALLGTILIVSRLFDVFTDPLIGYLSDRTRLGLGPRKPWIIAGALIVMIATWFWFRPGQDTGALYFLIWSFAVYIGWTMVEIPHAAWLSELTTDYQERSQLASFRTMGQLAGHLLFFCIPFLPFFASTEFTPEVTALASWIIIVMLGISVIFMVKTLPSSQVHEKEQVSVKELINALYRNRPFLIYFTSIMCTFLASGMTAGLYFFFMTTYLGIGEKIAHVGLFAFIVGLFATQLWPPIIKLYGKHRVLAISNLGTICSLVVMAFVRPGEAAFPMMVGVFVWAAITNSGSLICMLSIMADVVDYDEWKTGSNKAGSYFSFNTIVNKAGIAIGGGFALVIVGLFGFSVGGDNDSLAMTGFYMAFLGIPILLYITSIVLILNFPIDKRRHGIIRRRLDSLAQRKLAISGNA